MSVFTVIFFSGLVIGFSGLYDVVKSTDVYIPTVINFRFPFFGFANPSNSLVPTLITWLQTFVSIVLGVSTYAHIFSSAIQSISVFVIYLFIIWRIENKSMKKNSVSSSTLIYFRRASASIKSSIATFTCIPFETFYFCVISIANFGVLTFCEFYKFHVVTLNKIRSRLQIGMLSKHPGKQERIENSITDYRMLRQANFTTVCL